MALYRSNAVIFILLAITAVYFWRDVNPSAPKKIPDQINSNPAKDLSILNKKSLPNSLLHAPNEPSSRGNAIAQSPESTAVSKTFNNYLKNINLWMFHNIYNASKEKSSTLENINKSTEFTKLVYPFYWTKLVDLKINRTLNFIPIKNSDFQKQITDPVFGQHFFQEGVNINPKIVANNPFCILEITNKEYDEKPSTHEWQHTMCPIKELIFPLKMQTPNTFTGVKVLFNLEKCSLQNKRIKSISCYMPDQDEKSEAYNTLTLLDLFYSIDSKGMYIDYL